MKTRFFLPLCAALGAVASSTEAFAAKATPDLLPPLRRQKSVDIATDLTRDPVPRPLPAEVPHAFNPPNFDQPDPEELKANPAAANRSTSSATVTQTAVPAGPVGDRAVLETLAAKIPSTGTIMLGGKAILIAGTSRLRIGDVFTVTYDNQDYDLQLVAIDRTTFTLRYRGEEITRPIKSAK